MFKIFLFPIKLIEKHDFDLFIKYLSIFIVKHVDLRNMWSLYIIMCWIHCLTSHGTCELLDWLCRSKDVTHGGIGLQGH